MIQNKEQNAWSISEKMNNKMHNPCYGKEWLVSLRFLEVNETFFSIFLSINSTLHIYLNIYKRSCGMIANETSLRKRPNDSEINEYRSPYGLQQ